MKRMKKFVNRIKIKHGLMLSFILIILVGVVIFYVINRFAVNYTLVNSLKERSEYMINNIMQAADNESKFITNTFDTLVKDAAVSDYIKKSEAQRMQIDIYEEEFLYQKFKTIENSINFFEYLSITDEEGFIIRYGNAFDKKFLESEHEIMQDIYKNEDFGKLRISKAVSIDYEKDIIIYSKKYRIENKAVVFNIGISKEFFDHLFVQINDDEGESIIIVGEDHVFTSDQENLKNIDLEELYNKEEKIYTVNAGEDMLYVLSVKSYITGDKYCFLINESKASEKFSNITNISLAFVLVLVIISILTINYIIKRFLKLLMQFLNQLTELENEVTDESNKINIESESLSQVQGIYDATFIRIKNLLDYIQNKEKEISSIEKLALQRQINPHFVYNTLEVIQMVSEQNDDEEVSDMIAILGDIFRYGLSLKNEGLVTLDSELANIESYVSLMRYKLEYEFGLDILVKKEDRSLLIPKMTLQPIVENCFVHGSIGKFANGKIVIELTKTQNGVKLTVADNGDGFNNEQGLPSKKAEQRSGLALENIEKRLKLYFNKTASLRLESAVGKGTRVTISIPEQRRNIDD